MSKKINEPNDIFVRGEKTYALSGISSSKEGIVYSGSIRVKDLVRDVANEDIHRDTLIERTNDQWSNQLKSELIVSSLKNRPCGTIIMATGRSESKNYSKQSLIDGLQRTTAFCDYVNNKFALSSRTNPISCCFVNENDPKDVIIEEFDIAKKKFSQLPEVLQTIILNYSIQTCSYVNFSDEELDRIMFCVNSGKAPTVYQKIKYCLGSECMRLLLPLRDSTLWEDISDCNDKSESKLACIIRILMMVTEYPCKGYGSGEMMRFVEDFSDYVSTRNINEATALVEQLAEIKFKMTDDEIGRLNGCNIPNLIMNLKKFNLRNSGDKTYLDLLREFWNNDEKINSFEYYSNTIEIDDKKYSKYSNNNVCERQSILDNLLDEFLDGSNSDELFISPIANIYNNIGNNINNTVQCSRTIEPITPEIIPKEKIIATTTLNFPMCIKT